MLIYTKLWLLLNQRGMKKTDLKKVISSATLAKLGKNEPVSSTVIEKICDFLNCQPSDIMENVTKEDLEKAGKKINEIIGTTLEILTAQTGMSKEAILEKFIQEVPEIVENIKEGKTEYFNMDIETKNDQKE